MKKKQVPLIILLCSFVLFFSLPREKSSENVTDFLRSDKTDEIKYTEAFDCVQFSETLISNARRRGFDASGVFVVWKNADGSLAFHEFVTFKTKGGPMWIEPQNDSQYAVVGVGNKLCDLNGNCVSEPLVSINYESH